MRLQEGPIGDDFDLESPKRQARGQRGGALEFGDVDRRGDFCGMATIITERATGLFEESRKLGGGVGVRGIRIYDHGVSPLGRRDRLGGVGLFAAGDLRGRWVAVNPSGTSDPCPPSFDLFPLVDMRAVLVEVLTATKTRFHTIDPLQDGAVIIPRWVEEAVLGLLAV